MQRMHSSAAIANAKCAYIIAKIAGKMAVELTNFRSENNPFNVTSLLEKKTVFGIQNKIKICILYPQLSTLFQPVYRKKSFCEHSIKFLFVFFFSV